MLIMIPLTALRLRALFTPTRPLRLPGYTGSLWRGAFGHAFRRVVCGLDRKGCEGCPLTAQCPYPLFFEEGLHQAGRTAARYSAPPRPFVVEPGPAVQALEPGEPLAVAMVLIGDAGRWAASVAQALQLAGLGGIGADRVELEPLGIEYQRPNGTWDSAPQSPHPLAPAPAAPDRLTVRFETPLRIKRDGRLVTPERFRLADLHRALHRRTATLADIYGEASLDLTIAPLPDTPLHHTLQWNDWSRWSNRQRTKMKLGGLLGEIHLDRAALAPLWPLLWPGQWLHAGSNVSFGLGGYRILVE